jgi:ABC-type phosphate transport system substrate-binding protein
VAGVVLGNRYSIGYIELAYAFTNNINFGQVRNADGNFISPSLNSTAAAAVAAAPALPSGSDNWEPVSITDAPGAESYPIASFSYLLVYQEQTDRAKGQALVDFLWWVVHDGQRYSSALLYVPLPSSVLALNEASIRTITYQGSVLYTG